MNWPLAAIDDLLESDKALFGAPEWVEDGIVAKLTSPVIGPDNSVIGGLSLRLNALVHTSPQTGNAVLVLDERPLQRLSYLPDHAHSNPGAYPIPMDLRFKILPAGVSRIYRWEDNRVWPRDDSRLAGVAVQPQPPTIENAVEVFLEACGISAYIPPPPWRPELEL